MFAYFMNNPEVLIGGLAFSVQWGYSMHRLKTLESSIDEMKLELRELKK